MRQAHQAQSVTIQEGQRKLGQSGKTKIRQQAERIWWAEKANLPQKGQSDQENHSEVDSLGASALFAKPNGF